MTTSTLEQSNPSFTRNQDNVVIEKTFSLTSIYNNQDQAGPKLWVLCRFRTRKWLHKPFQCWMNGLLVSWGLIEGCYLVDNVTCLWWDQQPSPPNVIWLTMSHVCDGTSNLHHRMLMLSILWCKVTRPSGQREVQFLLIVLWIFKPQIWKIDSQRAANGEPETLYITLGGRLWTSVCFCFPTPNQRRKKTK